MTENEQKISFISAYDQYRPFSIAIHQCSLNKVFYNNLISLIFFIIPFCPISSRSFLLEWQSYSCLLCLSLCGNSVKEQVRFEGTFCHRLLQISIDMWFYKNLIDICAFAILIPIGSVLFQFNKLFCTDSYTGGRKPTHLTSANIRTNIRNICINAISIEPWGNKYRCPYKNTDVSKVVFHPLFLNFH